MLTVWYVVQDITEILNDEQLLIEQCYIYDEVCNTISVKIG